MNSRASFWMLGITGVLIAGALWFQLQQPAAIKPPQSASMQPQVVVTARPPAAEPPPELALLSEPAPVKPKKVKPPLQDPAARAALKLVGVDAAAEQIWQEAINNTSLPVEEREDLIEDLNEEGFSNGKKPTRADLPIIAARLKIIERLMPESIDQKNLDAFGEARKDLLKMQADLSR